MRRSHSSSNIPLSLGVHNQNRRDSKTREYGKTAVRTSRDRSLDNQTPLTQYRHRLGTDKKYSAQKNQLRTPSTPRSLFGFKRSGSFSSYGSRISVTRNKSPGDKKSLQKQINDKKWVAEQYAKIQNFIETRGLINPELAGKIRPPTIAIFIELVSVLFQQIIKTVPLNLQNYGDVVMQTLKLLRYPGQITASTFKTVNTMHGWPHFIAIISWLIDRVDLEAVHSAFREQQDEDVKLVFSMYDAVFEFLTTQHYIMLPNSENKPDEEFLLQSEDKLYVDMLKITGTDHEVALHINEKLENERCELERLQHQLNEIEDENLKIHSENLERQNIIDKYEESKGNREQEVKEELIQLKKTLNKHVETKAALVLSIKNLEDTILKQSCKFKEKTQFLSQIEDLKRAIERKERKLAEYRVVRDDLDMELRTSVTEIESKVDNWNVSITKTFLPELKSLCLREKGFHSTGFLQEIIEIRKMMEELQEKLLKEFNRCQSDIEKLQKQKEFLLESNKLMDSTKERLIDLRQIIESLKNHERTMISDLEACKSNHEINMKKIEESYSSKINEQEKVLKDLTDKKQKLIDAIDKTSKKGLSVIMEAHNMVIQNMKKIEEVAVLKVNDAKAALNDSQQNLQKSLDHFLSLRKTTAEMYQLADVNENKKNLPNN